MSEKVKHHRISMSQWSTLAVCPHFVPSHKPSPDAEAGGEAHQEAEEIWRKIQGYPAEEAFKFENASRPQTAWCAWRWRKLQLLEDIPESERERYAAACAVEMKLTIQQTDPLIDGIYGYADFVRLLRSKQDGSLKRITVADFKTFSDGTKNFDEQLAGYAVAVASTIPDAKDEIEVELITNHGAVKRDTMSRTTLGECRRIAVDVVMKYLCKDRFEKVLNPKCKYCEKYPCEGAIQIVKAVVPEIARLKMTARDLDENPGTIPLVLASLEEVQKLIDQTKANAQDSIKKHGTLSKTKDGLDCWTIGTDDCAYEVRQSLGSRKIPNVQDAFYKIVTSPEDGVPRLDADTFHGCCTLKVSSVESALKKAGGLKPDGVKELFERLQIIERGKTSESLKRIA